MGKGTRATRRTVGKQRACLGKARRYTTWNEAQRAAEELAKHQPWAPRRVPYLCPFAKRGDRHFHIGQRLGR